MNEKLLNYLEKNGALSQEQADALRQEHAQSRRPIRELLLEQSLLSEEQLIEALSAVSRIPTVRLYENPIDLNVRQLVRPDLLRTNVVMPFAFDPDDSGTLLVAINDPMNMQGRDLVAMTSKCRIRPYLATSSDILVTIDRYYGTKKMQEAAELYA